MAKSKVQVVSSQVGQMGQGCIPIPTLWTGAGDFRLFTICFLPFAFCHLNFPSSASHQFRVVPSALAPTSPSLRHPSRGHTPGGAKPHAGSASGSHSKKGALPPRRFVGRPQWKLQYRQGNQRTRLPSRLRGPFLETRLWAGIIQFLAKGTRARRWAWASPGTPHSIAE